MGNRSIPRHVLRHRRPRDTRALTAAGLGVVLVALIVFWPVGQFDFVNYDDLEFIVENPHVSTGLRADNVTWAFANAYTATGGPLTWLSHMADVEAFGMEDTLARVNQPIALRELDVELENPIRA